MTDIAQTINIDGILSENWLKNICESNEFYFQRGQDALNKWLELDLDHELKQDLLTLSKDYNKIQLEAESNPNVRFILDLLFEITAYCDSRAKEKERFNRYPDNRVLANAQVRMNHWVESLIKFKFIPDSVSSNSVKNAFDYLLRPQENSTILSLNHRKLVSKNLFKKPFDSQTFVEDLKDFFKEYNISTLDPSNYTHLLSRLVYSLHSEWNEEIVALMASDNTGWQEGHIKESSSYDYSILWNSKKPSGKNSTLNALKNVIEEKGYFNLYYVSQGMVRFKATIVDFASDQNDLNKKDWKSENVLYYNENFREYTDNKKHASIVFLAESFEMIEPLEISKFKFFGDYQRPTQDNITPIKYEPEDVEIFTSSKERDKKMRDTTAPLNQILFGPPGTGKTFSTTKFAISILEGGKPEDYSSEDPKELQKKFNRYVKEGRAEFITFHQSYSYEDFVVGIKPKLEGETMAFKRHEGVFYKICQRARENYLKSSKQATRIQIPFEEVFEEVLKPLEDNNPVIISNIRDGYSFKITKRNDYNLDFEKHSGGTGHKLPISTIKDVYEEIRNYPTNGLGTYIHPFVAHLKQKAATISKTIQDEPLKTYVLVIDEINRANISRVLGELITLLEPDKRLGAIQELEIKLSSGETFSVPPNLYIIGTMNTADKSIALLDIALRRRFVFKELLPDDSKVVDLGYRSFLASLNKLIFKKKGKDFLIGHSYFMSNNGTPVDLVDTMNHKVLPLLGEYFYNKELEIASIVKDAINNSDLKQQYVAVADPDGFNKIIFQRVTEETGNDQPN